MPLSVGTGISNTLMGGSLGEPKSKNDLQDTIARLERKREDYEKQRTENTGAMLDNRIKNLEDRISNLRERMNKLEEKDRNGECETCANRKYQDGSDDPGVSFKSASKISGNVEAAVRGHEQEHVSRNRAKAAREGREIVYQSVVIKHAICPECGTTYVAGGETTTVTRTKPGSDNQIPELSGVKAPDEKGAADGNGAVAGTYTVADYKPVSDSDPDNKYGVLLDRDVDTNEYSSNIRAENAVDKQNNNRDERFNVGLYDRANALGQILNIVA